MKYRIAQGLLRPPIEVEIEGPPPCLFCGTPVIEPSMNGPLVCGPCDMGRNPDGSRWTHAQARARNEHCRVEVARYRDEGVPPMTDEPTGVLLRAKSDAERQLLRWLVNLDADRVGMLAEAVFTEARRIEDAEGRTSKRLEDLKEAGTLLHALRQIADLDLATTGWYLR